MKCNRCKKKEIALGETYPMYFSMEWGDLRIILADTYLCSACINDLFDKIKKALWKDKK